MLEICASTVAWISLVVVQAFIHYFVIGARRERIDNETEAMIMGESLSFSGDSVESDINTPNTPTGDPTSFTISYFSSDRLNGKLIAKYEAVPSAYAMPQVSIELSEIDIAKKTPFYLTQTGTEVLKVCSKERCFWNP